MTGTMMLLILLGAWLAGAVAYTLHRYPIGFGAQPDTLLPSWERQRPKASIYRLRW